MTTESAPTPFEGAASIADAADALLKRTGPRASANAGQEAEDDAGIPADEADLDTETPPDDAEQSDDEGADTQDEADDQQPATTYKVKVGGEEKDVTLEELQKGYMMGADYGRKSREVAEARKAVMAERSQALTNVNQLMQETGFLAQTFMQRLVQGEQNTNWQELRATNPAEYAARMHDMEQNKGLLQRAYAAYQAAQAQQQELQGAQHHQVLADEAELVLSKIPEWLDPKVANTEKTNIAKFLAASDFKKDELDQISDHRFIVLARKAMLYDAMQSDQQSARKKSTKQVPALTRGGVNLPSGRQSRVDQATTQLRKNGKVEDAAAWLLSRQS